MNQIYIGFSKRNNNLISWLIRKIDKAPYSHVYIRRESKYGEYIYQASGLEVNFMNVTTFREKNEIIEEYEFKLTEAQTSELLRFCIKNVGKPYNIKDLFVIAFLIICKKVNIYPKIQGDGDASFKCSELAATLFEKVLNIEILEDNDFITPKELYPYIQRHGTSKI